MNNNLSTNEKKMIVIKNLLIIRILYLFKNYKSVIMYIKGNNK